MRFLLIRLRSLGQRINRFSPQRLREFLARIRKVTDKSAWILVPDMIWWAVVHEVSFEGYSQWDFHLLTTAERKTFITNPKSAILTRRYNSQETRRFFDDKVEFNKKFAPYLRREWLDTRTVGDDEAYAFLTRHGTVIAKNPTGVGGDGLSIHRVEEHPDAAAFRAALLAKGHPLIEQVLAQHPEMNRLNPNSVNTVRAVTFRKPDGTVHRLITIVKIGNHGIIDNFSHGGMYTVLTPEGVAVSAASDLDNTVYEVHPISGTTIKGFRIPMWDEVQALWQTLGNVVPESPYIGWDIAITPDGPAVIEGNHNTGVYQSRPSVSGIRIGALPRYREVIGPELGM